MRVEVIGSAVLDLQDKQRRCGVTGTRLQEASATVHAAISVCTYGLDMECCKYQTGSSFQMLERKGKEKKLNEADQFCHIQREEMKETS